MDDNNVKEIDYIPIGNDNYSKIVESYLDEIRKYPLLSKSEEKELVILAQSGDEEARSRMIESNLRLVVSIAKKYHKYSKKDIMSLISEGNIGLIKAIEKFDPKTKYRFSTYAWWWIKQSIMKYLGNELSIALSIPKRYAEKINSSRKKLNMLSQDLGRRANIDDIESNDPLFKYLQYDEEAITRSISYDILSNDSEEENYYVKEKTNENLEDPYNKYLYYEVKKLINNALLGCNNRYKDIIELRYGLLDAGDGDSKTGVARIYGQSGENIRQIENKCLMKLRKYFKNLDIELSDLLL